MNIQMYSLTYHWYQWREFFSGVCWLLWIYWAFLMSFLVVY